MRRSRSQSTAELEEDYRTACDNDDAAGAEALARLLVEADPAHAWAWFDLGLYAKRRRDWAEAARLNDRALALVRGKENPAAWNLGIAATATGDWATARRAWTSYGIRLPQGSGPIVGGFGIAPIRLNPEPRHLGETPLLIDGSERPTEVVWCRRLCPTRAEILNVPLPESGHRKGDIVLHDGEPVGTRELNGQQLSVFNELQRLEKSPDPTLRATLTCPAPADVAALVAVLDHLTLVGEDWSDSVVPLCRACSEGDAAGAHDHAPADEWRTQRLFGFSGQPEGYAGVLQDWAAAGAGRAFTGLEVVL